MFEDSECWTAVPSILMSPEMLHAQTLYPIFSLNLLFAQYLLSTFILAPILAASSSSINYVITKSTVFLWIFFSLRYRDNSYLMFWFPPPHRRARARSTIQISPLGYRNLVTETITTALQVGISTGLESGAKVKNQTQVFQNRMQHLNYKTKCLILFPFIS